LRLAATYGTVGTWPAFSWASLAALSPASWVGSSFGLKAPAAGAAVVAAEGDVAAVVVAAAGATETVVAAALAPVTKAPIIPPARPEDNIPAAIAADLRRFMVSPFVVGVGLVARELLISILRGQAQTAL
jgi:hypothetical protein